MFSLPRAILLSLGAIVTLPTVLAQTPVEQTEKYLWLEDVSSPRAMDWVKAENERTAKILEADPRFAEMKATALNVLESPDRLPIPDLHGEMVYNIWQDAQHVRGILRRATVADYANPQPKWQTVIDYDALGRADDVKWVGKGINCLYPETGLCLVELSAGGEDANTLREFDLRTGQFVSGGFVLPTSKQDVTWVDKDTLLVARDWGPGTMTKSGYAFVVKQWKRGQPLDQAKEIYRGTETDVSAGSFMLHDGQGHSVVMLRRGLNFFEDEISLLTPAGPQKLGLPGKVEIKGLLEGRIIVALNEDWKPTGLQQTFVQGSVVALDLEAVRKDPAHLEPTTIFAPRPKSLSRTSPSRKTISC